MSPNIISLIETDLAKPWFRRASPELKALEDVRREDARLRHARCTILLLGICFLLNLVFEFFFVHDVFALAAVERLAICPIITATILIRSFRVGARAEAVEREVALSIVSGTLMFCSIVLLAENHVRMIDYFGTYPIFFIAAAIVAKFPLRLAAGTCAVLFAIFAAALTTLCWDDPQSVLGHMCMLVWMPVLLLIIRSRMEQETYRVFLHAMTSDARQEIIGARNAELKRLSTTDALTGLRNRRFIDEALRQSWHAWAAGGDAFAIFLVDVDFFKRFNDTYGHQSGDSCLIQVAGAIEDVVLRQGGLVGRYGGEEFMAITPIDDPRRTVALGDAICRAVADLGVPHAARGDGCGIVSISLGLALVEKLDVTAPEALVTRADAALYRAKADGRNRCCLHDAGDGPSHAVAA